MKDWKECKLQDVSDKFAMGPFGSNIKAENFLEKGVPVIRGTNLNFYKYVGGNFVFLNEEKADQLKSSNCFSGDLVFTHRGTIGQVGLIPNGKYPRYVISQSGMKVTVNSKLIDNNFLFYFFKSSIGQHELLKNESQVGVPAISNPLTSLKAVNILLPPLNEQRAIAAILSSLDDKIDLLHRQNKTLEAMAETLFRQWFVNNDELRMQNDEWKIGKLGDVISIKGGTTPSTKESNFWDGNIYWTSPRDLSNHKGIFMFDTDRKITERGLAEIGSGLLPIGTVLLSSRAPIGYLAITEIPVAINQGYIAIVCDKIVSNYFMYLWCKLNMEEIKNAGNGSVFQEISKSVFRELPVIVPNITDVKHFNHNVSPIFEKIKINAVQIRTLEKLRDTLLPKLMSGEVRVTV